MAHEQVVISEPGYMYLCAVALAKAHVYLSNEEEQATEVYFDDFSVQVSQGPVIQVNDYYPYGMPAYSWVREGEQETREKFQGKQYESKTGWYDFHARQYDGAIGRFWAMDPANQFASGYVGMGNNPMMMIDPDGRLAWFVPIIIGAVVGATSGAIHAANDPNMSIGGGIWRGALIGALAGAGGAGVSAAGGGAMFAGAAGGAIGGAGFAGLQSNWNGQAMLRGGLIGAASGFVGGGFASAIGGGPGAFFGGVAGDVTSQLLSTGDLNFGQSLIAGGISFGMYHAITELNYRSGGKRFDNIELTRKEFRTIQAEYQRSRFWHKERGVTLLKNGDPLIVPKRGNFEGKMQQLRLKDEVKFQSPNDLGIDPSDIKAQWHSHWSKSHVIGFSRPDLSAPYNQMVTNRYNSYVNYNYFEYRPQDNFFAQYTNLPEYPVSDAFMRYFLFPFFRF